VPSVPESDHRPTELIAEQIRGALTNGDLAAFGSMFAPEARWGSCVGGDQIVQWIERARAEGLNATLVELEAHPDRVVVGLDLDQTVDDEPSEPENWPHYQVAFVVDGQITELQDASDREAALHATPSAPPPSPLGPRRGVRSAAPILPVRELASALEHYRQLGFLVRAYEGGGYGFIERAGVELHLAELEDLDPRTNVSAVYLYVDDADALHAEWRASGVAGEFFDPVDAEYGLREGAHADPDGNLIRFGSPLDD
jgi:SnoaL-like domain